MTIQTLKEHVTLQIPAGANISRSSAPDRGCQYTSFFTVTYIWHDGKLSLYEGKYPDGVPKGKNIFVDVYVRADSGVFSVDELKKRGASELWRYDDPHPHTRYPLIYYPKSQWGSSVGPQYSFQNEGRWGIRGTKSAAHGKPYLAFCDIAPKDDLETDLSMAATAKSWPPELIVDGEFQKHGDSKCRGVLSGIKNGISLGAMVDVWASLAPEIDRIYQAVEQEVSSYIQE